MTPTPIWRKSSRSQAGQNCVELSHARTALRDSKNPNGPTLRADLTALLTAIKTGRLTH